MKNMKMIIDDNNSSDNTTIKSNFANYLQRFEARNPGHTINNYGKVVDKTAPKDPEAFDERTDIKLPYGLKYLDIEQ